MLQRPEQLNRFVDSRADLIQLATAFPEYSDTIIQLVLEKVECFERIVDSIDSLFELARLLPKSTDTIIWYVLMAPEQFKRIFTDDFYLEQAVTHFPKYKSIFAKPTVAEALGAAKEIVEKEQNKRKDTEKIVGIYHRLNSENYRNITLFGSLPQELLGKIAALTRDPKVQSFASAYSGVEKHFKQ